MKKTVKYLFAALTLLAAASCAKDLDKVRPAEPEEGVTITASFEQTKTTLDNKTPRWATGDKIWISDGTNHATVEVREADNGKTTCSFTKPASLTGTTIYAVYPAASAKESVTAGKIDIIIPNVQDGSFENANICIAKTETTTMTFKNAAAILKFTQTHLTTKVHSIILDAATGISGVTAATPGETPALGSLNSKSTYVNCLGRDTIYMAVAPVTLAASTTKFTFVTDEKYRTKPVTAAKTLNVNDLVTIGNMDTFGIASGNDLFVQLWEDGPYWSKLNIGAASPQASGSYFTWGNRYGYWQEGYDDNYSFDAASYGSTTGSSLSGTLPQSKDCDAAIANWGDGWYLPGTDDFESLIAKTNVAWTTVDGVKGFTFTSKTDALKSIFLPAAGYLDKNSMMEKATVGGYWSDSSDDNTNGNILYFFDPATNPAPNYYISTGRRYHGYPIRPARYEKKAKAKYTMMIYASGGGNLDQPMLENLVKIIKTGYDSKVQIVAQIKLSEKYQKSANIDNKYKGILRWDYSRQYDLSSYTIPTSGTEEQKVIDMLGNLDFDKYKTTAPFDMGDEKEIKAFLNWASTVSPADNYILCLEEHGGSWEIIDDGGLKKTKAIYFEGGSPGTCPKIINAVKNSDIKKLKAIFFNSCGMAALENVYEYSPIADYFMGHSESTGGDGDEHLFAFLSNEGDYGGFYGAVKAFVDEEIQAKDMYIDNYDDLGIYDLSKLGPVSTALKNMSDNLAADYATYRSTIDSAIVNTLQPFENRPSFSLEDKNKLTTLIDDKYFKLNSDGEYAIEMSNLVKFIFSKPSVYSTLSPDIEEILNTSLIYTGKNGMCAGSFFHQVDSLMAKRGVTKYHDLNVAFQTALQGLVYLRATYTTGTQQYIVASPSIQILSFHQDGWKEPDVKNGFYNVGYVAANGYDRLAAIQAYENSALDKACKWSNWLKVNKCNTGITTWRGEKK